MGCGSCKSGSCSTSSSGSKSGSCGGCSGGSCNVLSSSDWLGDIFDWVSESYRDLVEVRFKAGRKEFFINKTGRRLYTGDGVMVETGAGLHLGFVSLQGEMAHLQLKKKTPKMGFEELKGIIRLAGDRDFDRFEEARNRELPTLYRTRQIIQEQKLPMKLSDVEFQADGSKATFFYSAEERVDFRDLIKALGSEFKVRVDMRQISLRQEAGRIGGIGTCGRELCCSTWLTDFKGVATSSARYQNLSLNPTKLSGQCGRLKCCLNFELDTYLHELKDIPKVDKEVQTQKGNARLQKTDIFRKIMWFAYNGDYTNWISLDLDRVRYIVDLNKKGQKPGALTEGEEVALIESENEVINEDLIALDKKFSKKKKKKKPAGPGGSAPRPANVQAGGGNPRPGNGQGGGQRPANAQTGAGNQRPANGPGPRPSTNPPGGNNPGGQRPPAGQGAVPTAKPAPTGQANQGPRPSNGPRPQGENGESAGNPRKKKRRPGNRPRPEGGTGGQGPGAGSAPAS